jgi:uncharacterized membrane protein YphA (DoxX/SURF4 family)
VDFKSGKKLNYLPSNPKADMNQSNMQKLSTALRVFLGVLFLWAAASKLANPLEFLASIYAYQVPLGDHLMKLVAIALPWFELLCGLLLVANLWTDAVLLATVGLLLIFLLLTGQAWLRGLSISCGCFNLSILGISETIPNLVKFVESVGFAFFRNLVLAAISIFLLRNRLAQITVLPQAQPGSSAVPESLTPAMLHKLRKQQKRAASAK